MHNPNSLTVSNNFDSKGIHFNPFEWKQIYVSSDASVSPKSLLSSKTDNNNNNNIVGI